MVYCVVPSHVARLRRSLERALAGREGFEVVVDGRGGERRAPEDRRHARGAIYSGDERRRVNYLNGRRVAERRTLLVPVSAPADLPRTVRANLGAVSFVEPLESPADLREDVEAVRAIVGYQSGERDLAELYTRWVDPVFTYLRVTADRGVDVEVEVARALAELLREARHAAPDPTQLRPWLFGLVHSIARPLSVKSPAANGNGATADEVGNVRTSLDWLSDEDLVLLIERRPPAERHLMVLRYFAGLSLAEIADVMDLGVNEAAEVHESAVGALESSLHAVTRSPRVEGRHPMGRLTHQTRVLNQRRRALLAL
jgi:DNA-directed RNA polymerase specialized sigma24 family protein